MTEPLFAEEQFDRPRFATHSSVRVRVPAKVNLHLHVGSPRSDGYHELTTVYHAIGLYDEITARRSDTLSLTMEGEGTGVLALDETNSGFDPSSQMVYLQNDMAGFAANAPVVAPPGKRWHYSSATTQLLARIVRDAVGGPEQTLAFAWRELFNPLGMRNVTLEFDGAGTLQGSTYMLASARDWAKFGLLYLNDGIVGGKRILHEDWVDFCAAATLDTDYAAGFWTNRSEHPNAKGRVRLGIPRDAFFASGDLGQRIVIMPSQHLVVVRLGDSVDPTGDIRGLGRLVKEVIAAVQP